MTIYFASATRAITKLNDIYVYNYDFDLGDDDPAKEWIRKAELVREERWKNGNVSGGSSSSGMVQRRGGGTTTQTPGSEKRKVGRKRIVKVGKGAMDGEEDTEINEDIDKMEWGDVISIEIAIIPFSNTLASINFSALSRSNLHVPASKTASMENGGYGGNKNNVTPSYHGHLGMLGDQDTPPTLKQLQNDKFSKTKVAQMKPTTILNSGKVHPTSTPVPPFDKKAEATLEPLTAPHTKSNIDVNHVDTNPTTTKLIQGHDGPGDNSRLFTSSLTQADVPTQVPKS
ncbi:hypothetical protein HDU76_009397, partial [Blyttiomyces sp. JEL0837]